MKNYLNQETQGSVTGDLTTLELCSSPTLPLPRFIPSPRNFQTRIQKKHSNQPSMSSSSLQCYRGLAALSSPRHNAGEGVPCPGGVLLTRPLHNFHSLGPPGWGCQPGRQCRAFCAVLPAAEPIQWRNYTSASAADASRPQSTLSLPNLPAGYWLHNPSRAQSRCFCARTDCNTGEQRPSSMSCGSADAYLCQEAGGMW